VRHARGWRASQLTPNGVHAGAVFLPDTHPDQAIRFTSLMVFSQAGHSAEKIPTFRFADIGNLLLKVGNHRELTSLCVFPRDPFGDVAQAQCTEHG
jgi:hypothetical protein